jgi:hypothetical protein
MIQTFQGAIARFTAWLAADPEHAELWMGIGLALTIGCIALLSFEQMKARTAEQG